MILVTYAPDDSRMNPIERSWSFVTSLLTGVTLPVRLDGEELPPWRQNELSEEEKVEKIDQLFFKVRLGPF